MKIDQNSKLVVVGVSANHEKYGHRIFRDLLDANYNVVGINPNAKEILGQEIFPSLADLDFAPDLVIIVVPPPIALQVLKEAHKLKFNNVWMQPGSESEEAKKFALENKMSLTTNACIMVQQNLW